MLILLLTFAAIYAAKFIREINAIFYLQNLQVLQLLSTQPSGGFPPLAGRLFAMTSSACWMESVDDGAAVALGPVTVIRDGASNPKRRARRMPNFRHRSAATGSPSK